MEMYSPYFATGSVSRVPSQAGTDNTLEYMGTTPLPKDPVVAMAYVPFQTKSRLYSDEQALKAGTLFEVLDKPFLGGSAR